MTTHPELARVYMIGAMGSRGLLYHSYLSQLLVQQACHDLLTSPGPGPGSSHDTSPSTSTSPSPDPSLASSTSPGHNPVPSTVSCPRSSPNTQSNNGNTSVAVQKDKTASSSFPASTNELLRPYWLSTRGYGSKTRARSGARDDSQSAGGEE